MSERVWKCNDLHVSLTLRQEVQAVRGVDFHLNKGETLAIVESLVRKSVTTQSNYKVIPRRCWKNKKVKSIFWGEDLATKSESELIKLREKTFQ